MATRSATTRVEGATSREQRAARRGAAAEAAILPKESPKPSKVTWKDLRGKGSRADKEASRRW